ncbi:MAG: NAD(P)-dependent oxidoreductase [Opitutaceae bacterium]|jgi:nucleoside-diphosphate-sugar epimerase
MNVVVTGGTGFIGSAAVAELTARGHAVQVLVRPSSKLGRLHAVTGWHAVISDSWNAPEVVEALRAHQPTAFVHCAWQGVGGAERNAAWQITANLRLTVDALELAKKIGCSQWVSLGSQAEYGNLNQRISEDCPTKPTTIYGKSKLIATEVTQTFCAAEGIKAAILRVFSTYGPGDAPAWLIPYIICELKAGRSPKLTACEQRWDYLYIEDAARAIACTVEARVAGVFNLGSGMARPLRDTVEIIRNEVGGTISPEFGAVPYRPDQVMWLEADITRLSQATGWHPTTSLESGIKKTVAFALANHHQD